MWTLIIPIPARVFNTGVVFEEPTPQGTILLRKTVVFPAESWLEICVLKAGGGGVGMYLHRSSHVPIPQVGKQVDYAAGVCRRIPPRRLCPESTRSHVRTWVRWLANTSTQAVASTVVLAALSPRPSLKSTTACAPLLSEPLAPYAKPTNGMVLVPVRRISFGRKQTCSKSTSLGVHQPLSIYVAG